MLHSKTTFFNKKWFKFNKISRNKSKINNFYQKWQPRVPNSPSNKPRKQRHDHYITQRSIRTLYRVPGWWMECSITYSIESHIAFEALMMWARKIMQGRYVPARDKTLPKYQRWRVLCVGQWIIANTKRSRVKRWNGQFPVREGEVANVIMNVK
jgi:hypothetical protein